MHTRHRVDITESVCRKGKRKKYEEQCTENGF